MAEIKIKKKSPVWPWILLVILIIAGVLYYLYYMGDDSYDTDDSTLEQLDDVSYNSSSEESNWDDDAEDTLRVNSVETY